MSALVLTGCVLLCAGTAPAQWSIGGGLEVVSDDAILANRIGQPVPAGLEFLDSEGETLDLDRFLPGDKPLLLNLVYFSCPGMCAPVMNGMVDALRQIDLVPGVDYELLTISFDPREGTELAAAKKKSYVELWGDPSIAAGWHFATSDSTAAKTLADAVGFRYAWRENPPMYDHPPALVFLSPKGTVYRYLKGPQFDASTLRLALVDTSEGTLGSFWDMVKISCLTYDPTSGRYTLTATTIMKIGGTAVLLFLAITIAWLLRRERRRRKNPVAGAAVPRPIS